jgi:hypothetical protein
MQLPKLKTGSKKPKQYVNQNPIEAIVSIGSGIKDSVVDDLARGGVSEAWDELLLKGEAKSAESAHGDLSEGHEIDLSEVKEKTHEITEMGHEFASEIIHAGKRASNEASAEIETRMHEILIEIRKLSESSAELKDQVEVITLESTADDPGIYHVNFLEKMLSFIHDLRLNVEDSLAWFGALRSKKAARQYGSMAKKHGTSFTLSNERQVATQVG